MIQIRAESREVWDIALNSMMDEQSELLYQL